MYTRSLVFIAFRMFALCVLTAFSQTEEKVIPSQAGTDRPVWQLRVAGKSIEKNLPIESLLVVHHLLEPAFAEADIRLNQNHLQAVEPFLPALGTDVEIKAGYHAELETIFSGRLVSHRIAHLPDEAPVLILRWEGEQIKDTLATGEFKPLVALRYGVNFTKFDLTLDALVQGWISFAGSDAPQLGADIRVNGLLADFNRLYSVIRIEHFLTDTEWQTTVDVSSPAPSAP